MARLSRDKFIYLVINYGGKFVTFFVNERIIMQVYRWRKDNTHSKPFQDLLEVSSHFCAPAAFTSWDTTSCGT
jgi:hypothetical protein